MRTLLAFALVALGAFIIWHGIDTEPQARTELDNQRSKSIPDFTGLLKNYPYTNAAIDARQIILDSAVAKGGVVAVPNKAELGADIKKVWYEMPENAKASFAQDMPYVQPYGAALIGVVGLLLALILPRTRFRGLAFLSLLLGAAAALAGILPLEHQVGLVNKFGALKYVIYNFPRVAQACVALAAITLAIRYRVGAPRPA
jgi:hypothetical protein